MSSRAGTHLKMTYAKSVQLPHTSQLLVYFWLIAWLVIIIAGFTLSYSDLVWGWDAEFRTAATLNFILFLLSLLVSMTPLCSTVRSKQMALWFFHFVMISPIMLVFVYFVHKYDWTSEYIFYYAFFFLSVPLLALVYLTACALAMFIYT